MMRTHYLVRAFSSAFQKSLQNELCKCRLGSINATRSASSLPIPPNKNRRTPLKTPNALPSSQSTINTPPLLASRRALNFHSKPSGLTYSEAILSGDISLGPVDFPVGWKDGRHPDDMKLLDAPVDPEFVWASDDSTDSDRLWYRVSFKTSNGGFLPASFLIASGAPFFLYLSKSLQRELRRDGRLLDNDTVTIAGLGPVRVEESGNEFNLIGAELMLRLGMHLSRDACSWGVNLPYW